VTTGKVNAYEITTENNTTTRNISVIVIQIDVFSFLEDEEGDDDSVNGAV
jgi:hypothetical protein